MKEGNYGTQSNPIIKNGAEAPFGLPYRPA
jgi:hypothetical protein